MRPIRGVLSPALLTSALLLAACGSETRTPLPDKTLDRLELTPSPVMVAVGESFQLTATAIYSDSSTEAVTSRVAWTVADPDLVRSGSRGRFETLGDGATTVEGTFEEVSATVAVTVTPSPLVSLAVQPSGATIEIGETRAFRARGTFEDGSSADITDSVTWTSEDEAVGTVDAGVATGVGPGRIDLTARSGDVSATARLTVNAPRLTDVRIMPALQEVPLGLTLQLTAMGTFSDGETRDVTAELDWTARTETIATVGDAPETKGLVTAVGVGQTTITAEGPDDRTATVTVRVTPAIITQLAIRPATSTIAAGEQVIFFAFAVLSDGSEDNVTRDVRWRSSAPNVAEAFDTAFERGQVIGRGAGQATLTVSDPTTGITSNATGGNAYVTVLPPTLQSISVTPRTVDVAAGLTEQFTATGNYSDGSSRNLTTQVEWTTTDTAIATIDAAGLLSGVDGGTVTVSAREPTSGVSSAGPGNATVTVLPPILQSFTIAPTVANLIEEGTQAFTAIGAFSDGVMRDVSSQVRWTTNSGAIRFTGNVATAVRAGTATVTASSFTGGVSSTNRALVSVIPLELVDLAVTPSAANLIIAGEAQFTATGTYNNTQVLDMTDLVTWSSSNPAAASVESGGPNAGLVTARTGGATTISVVDPASGASSADFAGDAAVTVSSTVSLVSIAVSAPTPQATIGAPEPMTALGTFSNGQVLQMTNTVQWSVSDPMVATISNVAGSRGVLTGVGTGTVSPMALHVPTGVRSAMNPVIEMLLPPIFNGSWNGPTQSVDGTGSNFVSVGTVSFTANQVGAATTVADVDLRINFLKTDGSCGAPGSSFAYHNEIGFQLLGPTGVTRTLVLANTGAWTGNAVMSGPIDVTFDDDAPAGPPGGTPQPGTYRPRDLLNAFNGLSPRGTWTLLGQDSAGGDPLCINNFTIILTVN